MARVGHGAGWRVVDTARGRARCGARKLESGRRGVGSICKEGPQRGTAEETAAAEVVGSVATTPVLVILWVEIPS